MEQQCRMCFSTLQEENLLVFDNMPKSAQFFPTAENAAEERGIRIAIRQCPYCGLVQAIGEPVPYFRKVIRATDVSEEMKGFRRRQFAQWVQRYQLKGKKVIEIGSGRGEYLSLMAETGALVRGLEFDPEAVAAATRKGLAITQGFVEDAAAEIPGAPYDAFFCLNFLEHIPQPGEFLKGICRNLGKDAYGLVEVPNFRMMIEKSMYSEFIQDHLSYFTVDTLEKLLANHGFEVLSVREIWYGYILSAEVRKRQPMDVSGMLEKRKNLSDTVRRYLRDCREKNLHIAVWGAGHQALANLSLLGMAEDIDCVIDSAPFKQNKLTPATHLPIVGPEILSEGTIDVVIIMAAGFSEEIRATLDRDHPGIKKAILAEDFLPL